MGVHDLEKYDEVKRILGIPEDEPIFILRAQDQFAPDAVDQYGRLAFDGQRAPGQEMPSDLKAWKRRVFDHADIMWEWQNNNKQKVKVPD